MAKGSGTIFGKEGQTPFSRGLLPFLFFQKKVTDPLWARKRCQTLRKWCLTPFLIVAVLSVIGWQRQLLADPEVMKTLSAHVLYVAEDGSSVAVDFRHPATDRTHRLIFFVDNETGFSGIDSLRDLRAGQVVSIDYVEKKGGKRFIRHISKVKLSGPPPGLENFNGI